MKAASRVSAETGARGVCPAAPPGPEHPRLGYADSPSPRGDAHTLGAGRGPAGETVTLRQPPCAVPVGAEGGL